MINYLAPDFNKHPGRRESPRLYERDEAGLSRIEVSIITPFFNTDEVFLETFFSLQAQSLQNWEWIVVDDGSSDPESLDRLSDVLEQDVRIKVITQKNAGPAAARNTGFQHSCGRFVCLLDSDDMIEPVYLEKCVWFLESHKEFAFCNSYSVVFGDQQYLWTSGFERGKAHLQANSGPPISVVRRSAYEKCGGFDESIRFGHEDWDFWLAMAKVGLWGYTIPEFLQWYRKRSNGRFEQIMGSGNLNDEFEKMIRQKYDGLEKTFPEVTLRHPLPYESVETLSPVQNQLLISKNGRRAMFLVPWMVTGGADRVNLDLIEGFVSRGHAITICATLAADHRWEHEFSRFTSDIFVLPNFLHVSDYPRFLAYLIQSRKIDTVIVTGSTLGYQLLPYLRAVSPGVAYIDMSHVEEPHWHNGGHPRFGVGYQDLLDLNVVTTQNLAKWMAARGADESRIRTIYTGVRTLCLPLDACRLEELKRTLGIAEGVPVIVFVGRLCDQKRPLLLAEIFKGLSDLGIKYQALVIGDGELKEKLCNLLDQYELLDCVHMLGACPHQQWLEILSFSSILLMPSKYEGISIALLEAIASGVVPVVANVGGQDEIVTPDMGLLIFHGDQEVPQYIEAIVSLLSNPGKIGSMSDVCKSVSSTKLSWDSMVDNFLCLIDEAHDLRKNDPRNHLSVHFGRELATQALECKRLGDAVDWLWNSQNGVVADDRSKQPASLEAQAVARFAIMLSQTWLGLRIIRNPFLKGIARSLYKKGVVE